MDVTIDDKGIHVGSRLYVGQASTDSIDDIGLRKYDGKILWYPDGRHQIVKASQKVFRVPVPGVLPRKLPHPDWVPDAGLLDDYELFESDQALDAARERKREDNLQRAKTRVKQIIMLNEFKYFL